MIRRINFLLILGMFAIFSILNVSGLGEVYKTDNILRILIYVKTVPMILFKYFQNKKIADNKDVLFILCIILVFEGSSIINGYDWHGLKYLTFYLCTYIISTQKFDKTNLFILSCIYGIFGTGLLLIMNYTTILSGWNYNSISIICLQSFLVFHAAFETNIRKNKYIYIIVILLNIVLLEGLDSRSAILCSLLVALLRIPFSKVNKLLKNKIAIVLILLLPLIIAIVVVLISSLPAIESLNNWSIERFSKPIFNGRDVLWSRGLSTLNNNVLFGHGEIYQGYWHNSAIACLYSYGIIGYVLYVAIFAKVIFTGRDFIDDTIVRNTMIAFLILNFQQSFENTLFRVGGIYMPYILLGILIGRVRYIKENRDYEKDEHYYSDL